MKTNNTNNINELFLMGLIFSTLFFIIIAANGCTTSNSNLATCGRYCNKDSSGLSKYSDDNISCECALRKAEE